MSVLDRLPFGHYLLIWTDWDAVCARAPSKKIHDQLLTHIERGIDTLILEEPETTAFLDDPSWPQAIVTQIKQRRIELPRETKERNKEEEEENDLFEMQTSKNPKTRAKGWAMANKATK